ncbi:MAG: RimK family alpha-L-glutamate ligase [Bacillales bacterium]|nr:RimK family alpha-L-glutamate ligase [Bacillales bacterium]
MKKYHAWIIYNGFLTHSKFLTLFAHLQSAMRQKNITCQLVKHHELIFVMHDEKNEIVRKYIGQLPDFILFWDKDILLAQQLEACNIPLYNCAKAIEICDHKGKMHQILSQTKIPMPKTIIAPHVFPNCSILDWNFHDSVIETLKLPLIIKEAYGSFGFQVHLAKTKKEVYRLGMELQHRPHIYQEYIRSSHGRDIRLQVVGNQVVAAIYRESPTDFRANITNGAIATAYTPSEIEKQLAITATQTVGADFAGVDLLFGENDEPLLCEINTNAHFINLMNSTGIDVAPLILDHILQDMEAKKTC